MAALLRSDNRLTIDDPDDLGAMHADQADVCQILFNLPAGVAWFAGHAVTHGAITAPGARHAPSLATTRPPL